MAVGWELVAARVGAYGAKHVPVGRQRQTPWSALGNSEEGLPTQRCLLAVWQREGLYPLDGICVAAHAVCLRDVGLRKGHREPHHCESCYCASQGLGTGYTGVLCG